MEFVSLLILLSYMIYAGVTVGITPTLSETFYKVKQKWAFTVALDLTAFSLLPVWLEHSTENYQFLAFLACAALCFIGTSPAFKQGMDRKIHITSLVICILALMAWCILAKLWLIPIIALAIGIPLAIKFRQYAGYILECCAFVTAFASVIISKYWF